MNRPYKKYSRSGVTDREGKPKNPERFVCVVRTSPGEERGNETGKIAIAHGSVEFCEATPIGLADES